MLNVLGIKTVEVNTENPIQDEEERREREKERRKSLLSTLLDIVFTVIKSQL